MDMHTDTVQVIILSMASLHGPGCSAGLKGPRWTWAHMDADLTSVCSLQARQLPLVFNQCASHCASLRGV